VPAEEGARSEASEWDLRERREREEEEGVREAGHRMPPFPLPRHPPSWPLRKRSRKSGGGFPLPFRCNFLGALYCFCDKPRRRAKGGGGCNEPPAD